MQRRPEAGSKGVNATQGWEADPGRRLGLSALTAGSLLTAVGQCGVSLSNPRPHHILDSVYVGLCCWNQERMLFICNFAPAFYMCIQIPIDIVMNENQQCPNVIFIHRIIAH